MERVGVHGGFEYEPRQEHIVLKVGFFPAKKT